MADERAHRRRVHARAHWCAHQEERRAQGASLPGNGGFVPPFQRRGARGAAFMEAKGASVCSQKKAQGAADRARQQASRTYERDPARPHAPHGAEMDLADTTSESDTSDPGGMPQLFRRSSAPDTRYRRTQQAAPCRQREAQGSTSKPTAAGGPQGEAMEPALLKKHRHEIRQEGTTKTDAILRIACEAREKNKGGVRKDEAVAGTGGRSTADADESPRRGRQRELGSNPDLREAEAGGVRVPVPNKPPERWGETIWRLAAYAESREHVWINVIRSYQREGSEITLAASRRLGCNKPKEGCMFAVHIRAGACPITEGPIRTWTVEAIRQLEPGDSPDGSGQNPVVEGAVMLIGLRYWDRVEKHLRSGWRSIEMQAPRKGEMPLKWHLNTRKMSSEEVYLDVCKGAGIEISEITHEAAEMMGLPQGSAYQVHVKGTRVGSNFRTKGVSFIRRTAARGTGCGELPAWERPNVLLGMKDAERLEGYLRAG